MGLNRRVLSSSLFSLFILFPFTHSIAQNSDSKFSPSEMSSLKLWLAPESLSALKHGDRISAWEDSSQKLIAKQTESTRAPTLEEGVINKHSAAHFNGLNEFLELPEKSVFDYLADLSVYFVMQPTARLSRGYETIFGAGERGDNPQIGLSAGRMMFFNIAFVPTSFMGNKPVIPQTWHLLEYHKEVEEVVFIDNGENVGGGKFSTPASNIRLPNRTVGCGGVSDECFEGDVAEILIYDQLLSAKDRRQNTCGLAKKYQLKVKGC